MQRHLLACVVSTVSLIISVTAIGRFSELKEPLHSSPLIEMNGDVCELPLLTRASLQQHADEVNRAGVTRVRLNKFDLWHDGGESFREFCSLCPQLVELHLSGWQIGEEDLFHALSILPDLRQLTLDTTHIVPSDVDWSECEFSLTRLGLYSPRGVTDEMITNWLGAFPKLRQLYVSDKYPPIKRDPYVWQWESLRNMNEVYLENADDAVVEKIVAALPKLRSLRLYDCEAITGSTWTHDNWRNLKELNIEHCPKMTIEATNELIRRTPKLETLHLDFFTFKQTSAVDLTPLSELRDLYLFVQKRPTGISQQRHLERLSVRRAGHEEWSPLNLKPLTRLRSLLLFAASSEETLLHLPTSIQYLDLDSLELSHAAAEAVLRRQTNLETLTMNGLFDSLGAVNEADSSARPLDFSRLTQLRELAIINCFSLSDQVIANISRQVPGLEQLRLGNNNRNLTGDGWDLSQLSHLRHLELTNGEKLLDNVFTHLPTSLEELRIHRCEKLTGSRMDFRRLPRLKSLSVTDCPLTTIGSTLPSGLQELNMWGCSKWTGQDLDFSTIGQMQSMSFRDCRELDCDRVLAAVTRHARVLQYLNLNGCQSPKTMNWDLSHLRNSLREIDYAEGEGLYFGGINNDARERMKKQIPTTRWVGSYN